MWGFERNTRRPTHICDISARTCCPNPTSTLARLQMANAEISIASRDDTEGEMVADKEDLQKWDDESPPGGARRIFQGAVSATKSEADS